MPPTAVFSTEYEEQQSSLEIQMSAFREQIDARPDWKLAGIYADRGISGTQVQNRTEFLRMMDDCESGLIDYIITKLEHESSRMKQTGLQEFTETAQIHISYMARYSVPSAAPRIQDEHLRTGRARVTRLGTVVSASGAIKGAGIAV